MSLAAYFFLYPAGHFGLTADNLFVVFPFIQVIDVLRTDTGVGVGEGTTVGAAEGDGGAVGTSIGVGVCVTLSVALILKVGDENVKFSIFM